MYSCFDYHSRWFHCYHNVSHNRLLYITLANKFEWKIWICRNFCCCALTVKHDNPVFYICRPWTLFSVFFEVKSLSTNPGPSTPWRRRLDAVSPKSHHSYAVMPNRDWKFKKTQVSQQSRGGHLRDIPYIIPPCLLYD